MSTFRKGPWPVALITMAALAILSNVSGVPAAKCPTTQSPWDKYNRLASGCSRIHTKAERLTALNAALEKHSVPAYAALVRDGCLDCDLILYGKDNAKDWIEVMLTADIHDVTGEIDFLRAKLYFEGKLVSADYANAVQHATRAFEAQWVQAADIAAGASLAQGKFEEAYSWYRKCTGKCQRTTIDQEWLLERLAEGASRGGSPAAVGDVETTPHR
jgi:hypothetical protein